MRWLGQRRKLLSQFQMYYVKGEVRSDVKIKPRFANTDRKEHRSIKSLLCLSSFTLRHKAKKSVIMGRLAYHALELSRW